MEIVLSYVLKLRFLGHVFTVIAWSLVLPFVPLMYDPNIIHIDKILILFVKNGCNWIMVVRISWKFVFSIIRITKHQNYSATLNFQLYLSKCLSISSKALMIKFFDRIRKYMHLSNSKNTSVKIIICWSKMVLAIWYIVVSRNWKYWKGKNSMVGTPPIASFN